MFSALSIFLTLIAAVIATVASQPAAKLPMQCSFEKSGYFVLLAPRMSFDEAAMACVGQGAVLAPLVDGVAELVATCAEWEMDSVESWVARRMGDIQCPFLDADGRLRVADCGGERRGAVCWRYPIALATRTHTVLIHLTATDYAPSIVSTKTEPLRLHQSTQSTFTWTNTITETQTRQRRVPTYVLEYRADGGMTTLTHTIYSTRHVVTKVPSATLTEEEYAVAVHYSTLWETEYTKTASETLSVNCK